MSESSSNTDNPKKIEYKAGEVVELPLLPLRDLIIFPHMMMPLFVGREKSINALEEAMNNQTDIFLAAQK